MSESVSILRTAIKQQNWEAAALCLLIGIIETAQDYSPEALDALIAELESAFVEERPRERRSRWGHCW